MKAEKMSKVKQAKRKKTIKEQYQSLCDKFDIKNNKKDPLLQVIKRKFCGLKFEKDRQAIIYNVRIFKRYCEYYLEDFNLHRYFSQEWFKINYRKKYPKIYYTFSSVEMIT